MSNIINLFILIIRLFYILNKNYEKLEALFNSTIITFIINIIKT